MSMADVRGKLNGFLSLLEFLWNLCTLMVAYVLNSCQLVSSDRLLTSKALYLLIQDGNSILGRGLGIFIEDLNLRGEDVDVVLCVEHLTVPVAASILQRTLVMS